MESIIQSSPKVDLLFPVQGLAIPRDHAYFLYSTVSRLLDKPAAPIIHDSKEIGLFPIRGTPGRPRELLLDDGSTLRLRTPADKLPALLPLAGKSLDLAGCRIRIGVPRVEALIPAPVLASPLVLIKLARIGEGKQPPPITPETFLPAAQKQLTAMHITAQVGIQAIRTGERQGQPRRRVIRVHKQTHVGYAVIVQGLTAEESIRLQEVGLGGRRVMGCGLFLPVRGES